MKLSAMIVSAFMMLAACTETVQKQKIPGATYMGGNNTITEICQEWYILQMRLILLRIKWN